MADKAKLDYCTLFPLLSAHKASINSRGKPTGKVRTMLNDSGFCIGPDNDREPPKKFTCGILEALLKADWHMVLQASEGRGIKLVDSHGMSRAVVTDTGNKFSVFCLKLNRHDAIKELKKLELKAGIRENSKNEFVYLDFEPNCEVAGVVKMMKALPESSECLCGHKNDSHKGKTAKPAIKKPVGKAITLRSGLPADRVKEINAKKKHKEVEAKKPPDKKPTTNKEVHHKAEEHHKVTALVPKKPTIPAESSKSPGAHVAQKAKIA